MRLKYSKITKIIELNRKINHNIAKIHKSVKTQIGAKITY